MKKTTIYCKKCGKPRIIFANNVKSVTLCIECYYKKRREYNTAYVYRWRKNKKKQNTKKYESVRK